MSEEHVITPEQMANNLFDAFTELADKLPPALQAQFELETEEGADRAAALFSKVACELVEIALFGGAESEGFQTLIAKITAAAAETEVFMEGIGNVQAMDDGAPGTAERLLQAFQQGMQTGAIGAVMAREGGTEPEA